MSTLGIRFQLSLYRYYIYPNRMTTTGDEYLEIGAGSEKENRNQLTNGL